MKRQMASVILLVAALGFATWGVAHSSERESEHEVILKPSSKRTPSGSPNTRILAEGVFGSEASHGIIPEGIEPVKRPQGRKGRELSTPLLFPQPETLACDDGIAAGEEFNGVDEWNEAVRLTPSRPCTLIALLYLPMDIDQEFPALTWGVWDDDGLEGLPSTLLDSGTVNPTYTVWYRVDLNDPIFIPSGEEIYAGWLDLHGDPYYHNAFDTFLDSCNYWFDGASWMVDPWFEGDFLIHGICGSSPGVAEEQLTGPALPRRVALLQNRPNPFSQHTEIRYQIPENGIVSLKVYDLAGRLVRTLVESEQDAGARAVRWDGRDDTESPVPSGIYLYRMKAGGFVSTRKLTLLQ